MANLQINSKKNTFAGLRVVMFLFFLLAASPILFFLVNLLMGNADMFMINGAKLPY